MPLETLRWAALAAVIPLLVAYADTPFRTFGQKFLSQRGAERLVLFSIELNLLLLWALTKLLLMRDAALVSSGPERAVAAVGVVLAWAGSAFAIWARVALGRWFSGTFGVKQGHALVTTGPYGIVRHPMYSGCVVLGVGLALAWNSAVTLGFTLLYVLPFWMHTMIEEQMFGAHFGEAWAQYKARVPRLVPGMSPKV